MEGWFLWRDGVCGGGICGGVVSVGGGFLTLSLHRDRISVLENVSVLENLGGLFGDLDVT